MTTSRISSSKYFADARPLAPPSQQPFAPTGQDLIAAIFPSHTLSLHKAMSGLSLDEQAQAIDLLRKLGLAAQESYTNTL